MPRMARVIVPQIPHHIIQRGHNLNRVFGKHKSVLPVEGSSSLADQNNPPIGIIDGYAKALQETHPQQLGAIQPVIL